MRRRRLALLISTTLLLVSAGLQADVAWQETRVTADGASPRTPKVWTEGGTTSVWFADSRNYQSGFDEITKWQSGTEAVVRQIPYEWGTTIDSLYGDRLVLRRRITSTNHDLYLWNSDTGIELPICVAGGKQQNADLYQGTVAYEDHSGSVSRVMVWEESTGISTPVASSSYEQVAPKIWGDRVVWQENRPSGARIYSYSPSEGTQLIGWGMSPGVYEDRIVAWTRAWWDDFDPFHQVYHPGTLWQWTPAGGIETLAEHSYETGFSLGTDMWGDVIVAWDGTAWDPTHGLTYAGVSMASIFGDQVVGVRDYNVYIEKLVPEPSTLTGVLSTLTLSGLFWRKRRPG